MDRVTVIHIRDADLKDPRQVYIGRGNARLPRSPLHNPYPLPNEAQREACIARYLLYLRRELKAENAAINAELDRLVALASEGPIKLVCYCAPRPCHGDIIKEMIEDELDNMTYPSGI
jgi:hypothetical protein